MQVIPTNLTTDVATNIIIEAHFAQNTALHPSSVNSSTVYLVDSDRNKIAGTVKLINGHTITFTPHFVLKDTHTYHVYLVGDTNHTDNIISGIRDILGNPLPGIYTWEFITRAGVPVELPIAPILPLSILKTKPLSGASGVSNLKQIEIEFNVPLDAETVIIPNAYVLKTPNI